MLHLGDISAQPHVLSIRLSSDGFSFSITDLVAKVVKHFQHFPLDFHQDVEMLALEMLCTEKILDYPFQEVRILIDTPEVTAVPSPFYEEGRKKTVFEVNANPGLHDYVLSNRCSAYDVEILFAVSKELYAFFNKNFTKIKFVHQLTLTLYEANAYALKAQEQLFIAYANHHFTAVALRNNNLIYHNGFKLVSPEDLTYFLLLIFQELGFDQYHAAILVNGAIGVDNKSLNVVREYVKHLDFSVLPKDLVCPEIINSAPEHFYSNFLSLPFCE